VLERLRQERSTLVLADDEGVVIGFAAAGPIMAAWLRFGMSASTRVLGMCSRLPQVKAALKDAETRWLGLFSAGCRPCFGLRWRSAFGSFVWELL
jgi:hypothetical protein